MLQPNYAVFITGIRSAVGGSAAILLEDRGIRFLPGKVTREAKSIGDGQ